ncbi:hypothetical protein ACFQJD_14295 [Haloplanus sp. GCM10025708]|uniref:hypothetical protein n=1 Tax=Haloferacaceae TaxID=1644056 RepID=UPI0036076780
MKRRALLSLVAGVPVGGCLGRQPLPRIAWIRLVNDRDEAYDVGVFVDADGEQVFSEQYHLGTTPDSATVLVESPVEGTGRYVVRADVDGQIVSVDATRAVDGDENCVGVRFSLHRRGTLGHRTESMQECRASP